MKRKITLLLFVATCLFSWSATWTVNSLADVTASGSGDIEAKTGDLQFCVTNSVGSDIITFANETSDETPVSMNGATIKFTVMLAPGKALTFDASNLSEGIIFDGQGTTRLFNYNVPAGSPAGTGNGPTFNNITFQNSLASGANNLAGAILVVTDYIKFINCKFLNNSNIYATNNTAGAIFHNRSVATMEIINCVFKNNTCPNRQGGAIMLSGAKTTIDNCVFDGNTASNRGGAIMNQVGAGPADNVLLIKNSTFTNNGITSTSTSDNGYVINSLYTNSTTPGYKYIKIINCTFVGNTSATANKACIATSGSKVEIAGSIFGNNKAAGSQGIDISLSNNTEGIISNGYNIVNKLAIGTTELASYAADDVKYTNWDTTPLLNEINSLNVMTPVTSNANWKLMKIIPLETETSWLGDNPKDYSGNLRDSRLAYAGAYELPAYVLDMADDDLTTPAKGVNLYLKDEEVTLSSTGTVSKWIINYEDNHNTSPVLTMDMDYTVTAVYGGTTEIDEKDKRSMRLFSHRGNIKVLNSEGAEITIFSITGQKLISEKIESDHYSLDLNNKGLHNVVVRINKDSATIKSVILDI